MIKAGAVAEDGSGFVRVLPAGRVPGGGRLGAAVGVGLDLADPPPPETFGLAVGAAVAVGEAVGDGLAATPVVALSTPNPAREARKSAIKMRRRPGRMFV